MSDMYMMSTCEWERPFKQRKLSDQLPIWQASSGTASSEPAEGPAEPVAPWCAEPSAPWYDLETDAMTDEGGWRTPEEGSWYKDENNKWWQFHGGLWWKPITYWQRWA